MKSKNLPKFIKYPIYDREPTIYERLARKLKKIPIKCTVCGAYSIATITNNNFRENCYCKRCNSFNRQRQLAFVLCNAASKGNIASLKELSSLDYLSIYNTETSGAIHRYLSCMEGYECSEFFGPQYLSGEIINDIMHQDLMGLSFEDNKFDYVISTDVFEHVPEPYKAHQEVFRVLKSGGRHIFTVPFYQTGFLDENRSSIDLDGNTLYHEEPLYHIDPLRPDGILVYNIFSIEMLVKLAKIGFRTNIYHLYRPYNGILGPNGIVFEAIKENND